MPAKELKNIKNVACAIIESYLNIRKSDWGLDVKNPKKLDPSATERTTTCLNFYKDLEEADTIYDFIKIIHELSKETRLGLSKAGYLFNRTVLAAKTLAAVRSYLIFELQRSDEIVTFNGKHEKIAYVFNKIREDLRDELENSESLDKKQELEKLSNLSDWSAEAQREKLLGEKTHECFLPQYHKFHYFHEITQTKDAMANTLSENSFADFEKHVLNGRRKLHLVEDLQIAINQAKQEAESTQTTTTITDSKKPEDQKVGDDKANVQTTSAPAATSAPQNPNSKTVDHKSSSPEEIKKPNKLDPSSDESSPTSQHTHHFKATNSSSRLSYASMTMYPPSNSNGKAERLEEEPKPSRVHNYRPRNAKR